MKHETIIHCERIAREDFTMAYESIRGGELDLQALGLLVHILDKPNDWTVHLKAIAKELKISKRTIERIFNRLVDAGYAHREIIRRNVGGKFQTGALIAIFEKKRLGSEWMKVKKAEYYQLHDLDDVPF